jgi:helix-turn-helix protein
MQDAETYLKNKKQTAKFLGVSEGSLERLMRSGLQHVKLNGLVRFRPEDIDAFIMSRVKDLGKIAEANKKVEMILRRHGAI